MSSELNESLAVWIAEHCAQQAAERAARAERKKTDRAEHKRARDWGLKRRHATKLARIQQHPSIT